MEKEGKEEKEAYTILQTLRQKVHDILISLTYKHFVHQQTQIVLNSRRNRSQCI